MKAFLLFSVCLTLRASTYYLDSGAGNDGNNGLSPGKAWKTLAKVNATVLRPGDRVLFQSGGVWRGALNPKGSGSQAQPVIFDRYAKGAMPRIDCDGSVEDAVRLYNMENVELRNLEITNHGEKPSMRRGVHVVLDNFGTAHHIMLSGLYIHDVNGSNGNGDDHSKDNGGIIFRTLGDSKPSRFDGLTIERNIVLRADRSGIAAMSAFWPRTKWFPSLHVVIRDNLLDDIGGDGIVPWATDGAIVEHNIARNCNMRANSYNAGIWPWSTDNSVFQLNEASFTRGTRDGEGFDSDFNSRNTLFQYNYSHDNEGGFMLICSPGKRDEKENVGNIGTRVEHNISRNDRSRAFNISAVNNTLVERNAIYVGKDIDIQMVAVTDWNGWPDDLVFRDNLFFVEGTARYGHEIKRNGEGVYELAQGWGPAKNVVFEGNRYIGNHLDRPEDRKGVVAASGKAPAMDWNEPQFDPSKPDGFDAYLAAHRKWLIRLFETQFGAPVQFRR